MYPPFADRIKLQLFSKLKKVDFKVSRDIFLYFLCEYMLLNHPNNLLLDKKMLQ
jgi:hypothetical protein